MGNLLKENQLQRHYKECDLNRFSNLEMLHVGIEEFNEYITFHPKQKIIHRVTCLDLNNEGGNHQDMQTFLSHKCIDFDNITKLDCIHFGYEDDPYDFDSFCDVLTHFPNVSNLRLEYVYLTEYNEENTKINTLFSKLTAVSIFDENLAVNLLRNKLLTMYSNQIEAIGYVENET